MWKCMSPQTTQLQRIMYWSRTPVILILLLSMQCSVSSARYRDRPIPDLACTGDIRVCRLCTLDTKNTQLETCMCVMFHATCMCAGTTVLSQVSAHGRSTITPDFQCTGRSPCAVGGAYCSAYVCTYTYKACTLVRVHTHFSAG